MFVLYPRTLQSVIKRSFQKSWHGKFSWLKYSSITDVACCFPCQCFSEKEKNKGQIDTAFTLKGFKDWYKLYRHSVFIKSSIIFSTL